jgi:hypothetical protein
MRFMQIFFSVSLLILLAGCGNATSTVPKAMASEDSQTVISTAYPFTMGNSVSTAYPNSANMGDFTAPTLAPQDPTKASINGSIFLISVNNTARNTAIYLTPALGEDKQPPHILVGALPEKGDILGTTDENGNFKINNIPPGDYYLVVDFPDQKHLAQISKDNTSPMLISLSSGQDVSLGNLYAQ